MKILSILIIRFCSLSLPVKAASKTDVIVLKNGDRITGEIKLWDYFLFSHPERNVQETFSIFPSLSDFGRYRASFDTVMKVELIKDLYFDISAYASYDSDPISITASQSDYGINSGLGYKF